MNIVDIVIFLVMSMTMVVGLYNGFVLSALHTASFFISWLIAVIFYPMVTKLILGMFPTLLQIITLYAEGSSHIALVEDRRASLQSFSVENISEIVEKAKLPNPFSKILVSDFSQSLEGIQTLGEYFDTTMAIVIINIVSFLILFLLVKAISIAVVSLSKTLASLPVLRKYDGLAGAGFGLVRGFFIVYLIFALIPILLVLAPTDIVNEYLDGSKWAGFFHHTNIFTNFVRGS
ncbi:MAG: CvpA family protein [Caldicoprobacterales bacterium]|jgi:uncharacterized membrane protein required for colicin V production|nr:CvpA family protein [Clostridiales bacterium]